MADGMRIGKVSSINYQKGTARVTYEDRNGETTPELPFLAWEYWMPAVGDQVLVCHLSTGTAAGVIIGPVWHDGHRPVEGFEGLYRREYARQTGQANERYDAQNNDYRQTLTGTALISATQSWGIQVGGTAIQLNSDGTIIITADARVTISTPSLRFVCRETIVNSNLDSSPEG